MAYEFLIDQGGTIQGITGSLTRGQIPAAMTITLVGSNFVATSMRGTADLTSTSLSDLLNRAFAAIDAAGGGEIYVRNMGTVSIAQWGTAKINVKQSVKLTFERGGIYNINITGDVFLAADANGRNKLYLDSTFNIYGNVTNFIHLTNSVGSEIFIFFIQSGSGAIVAGTKAVYLDGNPAYYNIITIIYADFIDIVIHFPFATVGANANTIPYMSCQHVNYGVKIDANVSDNFIQRMVIDGGGVATGSTHGGVYIAGFSNVIAQLYGEYSSGSFGGPLLYLDTTASKNQALAVVQEGSGSFVTNNATGINQIDSTSGSPISHRVGLDNRSGVTTNDGSPIVLFAVVGSGQIFRVSGHMFCTAYTSGTLQYTIGWTENGQAKTITLTATLTAANTFSDLKTQLIKPDNATNITVQITGITTATVTVAATVEQFA